MMKDKTETGSLKSTKRDQRSTDEPKISRREALKKAGIYAAFTATSMTILLSPKASQADSTLPEEPGGGWGG